MFESKKERLLPLPKFIGRMARSLLVSSGIVGAALALGVLGYRVFAGFSWIDALLEACMILTGMGPVGPMATDGAKLFASAYALFSGLVFIGVIGVVLAPLLHRLMHRFHLEEDDR
jgi:hypothetical protein